MRFTATELAEIRSAFRQRIAQEHAPKQPSRRKAKAERKAEPESAFVRQPDYDDDEVLTVANAAELFGVSVETIRRWADAGRLPSFRTLGGRRRFRWADVRALDRSGSRDG